MFVKGKVSIKVIAVIVTVWGLSTQECCQECLSGISRPDRTFWARGGCYMPGVRTYDSPRLDGYKAEKFCGAAWSENGGTCCNQRDLKKRARAWKFTLRYRYKAFKRGIRKFKSIVKRAHKIVQWVESQRENLCRPHQNNTQSGRRRRRGRHHYNPNRTVLTDEQVDQIKELLESYAQDANLTNRTDHGVSYIKTCFPTIQAFKINGLCLKCSGNATSYFNATTGLYSIAPSTCDTLLEKCAPVEALYHEVMRLYEVIYQLKEILRPWKLPRNVVWRRRNGFCNRCTVDRLQQWIECAQNTTNCVGKPHAYALCKEFSLDDDDTGEPGSGDGDGDGTDGGDTGDGGLRLLERKVSEFEQAGQKEVDNGNKQTLVVKKDGADLFKTFDSHETVDSLEATAANKGLVQISWLILGFVGV